ncbi:hypothetical protein E2C01_024376 [Portunus trituberculatus]|uniref:Uncharacterized protein n=1 Tax=Portunus trituberculatus TaxID=210409 RepID=A0A5B7EC51_PORTR|nr:hypothetical protein [Portunus trituberculatus]
MTIGWCGLHRLS